MELDPSASPVDLGGFRSGPPTEPASDPPSAPEPVAALLSDGVWQQVWVKAATEVWRIECPGAIRYLKVGPGGGHDGTGAEADRLRWLAGRTPMATPPVLAHQVDGTGTGWLVTDEVPGVAAHDPALRMTSVGPLVESLARGLRAFHDAVPASACPFDSRLDGLVERAVARVAAGAVDTSTMGPTARRLTAAELLDSVLAMRPDEPVDDLVVAHGDPCLPNLLVDPGTTALISVVDMGRVGVSDRYRDLAIVARSLVANLGPEVGYRFFDAYGLSHPDPVKLEFYVLLDDLW